MWPSGCVGSNPTLGTIDITPTKPLLRWLFFYAFYELMLEMPAYCQHKKIKGLYINIIFASHLCNLSTDLVIIYDLIIFTSTHQLNKYVPPCILLSIFNYYLRLHIHSHSNSINQMFWLIMTIFSNKRTIL